MDRTRITQQTTTALPLRGELTAHDAPGPRTLAPGSFDGRLQRALEGPGWNLLRPAVDFLLLCTALVISLGGVHATLHPPALRAPLLVLPLLVMLMFYLRG